MIRVFMFFILSTCSSIGVAQEYKDSVKVQFLRYTEFLTKKEFAKSVDYINPDFFKVVPKNQLVALIEQTYNNPDVDFSIEDPVITAIGESRKINQANYVKMQYSNFLNIRYKPVEGKLADTAATKAALISQFGKNNVTYDKASDNYRIFVSKNVVANSADLKNWTFVVIEERQKPILERFIPKELL